MGIIYNGKDFKNSTAVKSQVRKDVMSIVINALIKEYGQENVKKVGSNEYGVIVGSVIDNDGYPQDVVATIKPTVKEWEDRKTAKKTFEKFVLDDAAENYEIETKEKEEKAEKERKAKEDKKKKDIETRAKKKIEAEKKKLEENGIEIETTEEEEEETTTEEEETTTEEETTED